MPVWYGKNLDFLGGILWQMLRLGRIKLENIQPLSEIPDLNGVHLGIYLLPYVKMNFAMHGLGQASWL